jgi:metal-responsive CopG/Arc/MetJ family transcriptional regulator
MDEKTQRVVINLPPDMIEWLERNAKKRGWHRNHVMRWAIKETMMRSPAMLETVGPSKVKAFEAGTQRNS